MGRVESSYDLKLMTAKEIAIHLLRCCSSLAHFDSYMFGSTLRGIGQDIDILIVGPGGNALSQLKSEMAMASADLPLHVLYMQPCELDQTDFVVREKCIRLTQLASSETV